MTTSNMQFKLRDSYKIYATGPDQVVLRSTSIYTVLDGPDLDTVLPPLIQRMSLPFTIDQLFADSDGFEVDDLEGLVEDLVQQDIVVRDPLDSDEFSSGLLSQICYFSQFVPDGVRCQKMLRESTIGVIGLGQLGSNVVRALVQSGAENITLWDPDLISADDVRPGDMYRDEDIGTPRVEVVADRVSSISRNVHIQAVRLENYHTESLTEAIPGGLSMLVACLDDDNGLLALNRVCAAKSLRWISCRIDGSAATLGPAVIPGQTPCYECLHLWQIGNDPQPERRLLMEDSRLIGDRPKIMTTSPMALCAASLTASIVVEIITGISSGTPHGQMIKFDMHDMSLKAHRILQLPHCPTCRQGRSTLALEALA